MIIADTSVIFALLDGSDADHQRVAAWYQAADPTFVTTPLVLAEVDHLAGARAGAAAQRAWRADLSAGAYAIEWWDDAAKSSAAIADQYQDLGIGLTDASLVALGERLGTVDVATLDERHFRAIRPRRGGPAFRLLPADA